MCLDLVLFFRYSIISDVIFLIFLRLLFLRYETRCCANLH